MNQYEINNHPSVSKLKEVAETSISLYLRAKYQLEVEGKDIDPDEQPTVEQLEQFTMMNFMAIGLFHSMDPSMEEIVIMGWGDAMYTTARGLIQTAQEGM